LRPAGNLCREAVRFKSKITFQYEGKNIANAKSVLSVLGSCVAMGDEILLMCEGEDEEDAISYLVDFIERGLDD
jgi:phosphocarrier protein